MKADIILVKESGIVAEQYIVIDTITAEAQFDEICERILGDDYKDVADAVDYGVKFGDVNRYLEGFGKEIVWLEQVEINTYRNPLGCLRDELEKLKDDVEDEYRSLIKGKELNFTLKALDEYRKSERETVKELLDNEDFVELYEYDFQEFLHQVFYNDRRGEERMAYLLSADEKNGLYVLDSETNDIFFIGFSDLNGLDAKIGVIEEIEELD